MEDTANIVLPKEDANAFLRNLNNPSESTVKARRAFLEEIYKEDVSHIIDVEDSER